MAGILYRSCAVSLWRDSQDDPAPGLHARAARRDAACLQYLHILQVTRGEALLLRTGPVQPKSLNSQYFPGYVGCGLAYAAGLTLATAGLYVTGLLSSIKLHDKLITTVSDACMLLDVYMVTQGVP